MATVFTRALGLPASDASPFVDTVQSGHAANIDALAAAGITNGCNPPANTRFCPAHDVTRGQMAAFISHAMKYAHGGAVDHFIDDALVFESGINALAEAPVSLSRAEPTRSARGRN